MGVKFPSVLQDRFGRAKRKLRLSLTDRCNFRCRYCMPDRPEWLETERLMTRDELVRMARIFVEAGIDELRLTGGEPTLRADVAECVAALSALRQRGLRRLSMTTNGSRLGTLLEPLIAAGLDDLNISLDTVDPDRFRILTGRRIEPVLAGIELAQQAGLAVKLNAVLIQDYNDDQILSLVEWARKRSLPLRFIEFMPLDAPGRWRPDQVVSEARILQAVMSRYRVAPLPRGSAPATEYLLDGNYRLGVISTITKPFCASCDRLRLTADGTLYTCLFSRQGSNLLEPMRKGADDASLSRRIRNQVWHKDAGYVAAPGPVERPVTMHGMGG